MRYKIVRHKLLVLFLIACLALPTAIAIAGDGGLHLEGYCRDEAEGVLVLTERSVFGWGCKNEETGEITPINFVAACRYQYGGERPYPNFGDVFNPATISCGEGPSLEVREYLGSFFESEEEGLDLGPYCLYHVEWTGSEWVTTDESSNDGHGCEDDTGEVHEIDMDAACAWMYPQRETRPRSNGDNPWSWGCVVTETFGQG